MRVHRLQQPSSSSSRSRMVSLMLLKIFLLLVTLPKHQTVALAQNNTTIPFYNGDPEFLFLGNSYTWQNSLPNVFKQIVKAAIPEWNTSIGINSVAPGGQTLAGHFEDANATSSTDGGRTHELLVENPQDYKWVVLQDQSQVPGFWEWDWEGTEFYNSWIGAQGLNDFIQLAADNAQTMFYMTWGRRDFDKRNREYYPDFLTMQARLTEGYRRYVEATSTPERPTFVAPVGLVYKTIYNDLLLGQGLVPNETGTLFHSLYTGDGSHPSIRGTYTAALTIFTSMFGLDPELVTFYPTDVDEADARAIQNAVSRTILETFLSGQILYPWNISWTGQQQVVDGTSVPTTNMPTVAPTTEAPTTLAPTTTLPSTTDTPTSSAPTTQQPTTSVTKGSITVVIVYDDYPEDIAWTLLEQDTGTVLFFQGYNSTTLPGTSQTITFDDLDVNQTLSFKLSDRMRDGICCSHGNGYAEIYDSTQTVARSSAAGKLLVRVAVELGAYTEADLTIGDLGHVTVTGKADTYVPLSWPDLETLLYKPIYQEPEWPGKFPSNYTFSLVVNVDLDNHPEDVSWELFFWNYTANTTESWNYDGKPTEAGLLHWTELSALQSGWYRFIVTDSQQNGLCCSSNGTNSNGYITLTGPLAATQNLELIWGSNGMYQEQDEIQFRMDENGYISHIQWDTDKMARTQSPTSSPTTTTTTTQIDRISPVTPTPTPDKSLDDSVPPTTRATFGPLQTAEYAMPVMTSDVFVEADNLVSAATAMKGAALGLTGVCLLLATILPSRY